jgi:hypothetical protein
MPQGRRLLIFVNRQTLDCGRGSVLGSARCQGARMPSAGVPDAKISM